MSNILLICFHIKLMLQGYEDDPEPDDDDEEDASYADEEYGSTKKKAPKKKKGKQTIQRLGFDSTPFAAL